MALTIAKIESAVPAAPITIPHKAFESVRERFRLTMPRTIATGPITAPSPHRTSEAMPVMREPRAKPFPGCAGLVGGGNPCGYAEPYWGALGGPYGGGGIGAEYGGVGGIGAEYGGVGGVGVLSVMVPPCRA